MADTDSYTSRNKGSFSRETYHPFPKNIAVLIAGDQLDHTLGIFSNFFEKK